MLYILLTAAAYFYFNWVYFALVKRFTEMSRRRVWLILMSFAVNYLFFYLCSMLEFPLVINWVLFSFLLFLETLLYNRGDRRCALFSTLLGILYGLAVNILCRSIVAIVACQPLQSFDNHVSDSSNLKGIPVCLGFLLAGAVLQMMGCSALIKRFRSILYHPKQQSFLLEIMSGLFFYLFLNLMLYSTPLNLLILKVWSIKSCLFCFIGFYIAVLYTRRICELSEYREKNRRMEQELKERQREGDHLRRQATLDMLTGLYNRQAAEEEISAMTEQGIKFTLCFMDLDGLKNVSDRFGHDEGDHYILTATEQLRIACQNSWDSRLFRYGGDEFLLLFAQITVAAATQRMEILNYSLHALEVDEDFPYSLSVSYGVVDSSAFFDWHELIPAADRAMYAQKQQKQMARN